MAGPSDLHVTIARLGPAAHVASLAGELDEATAPLLLRRLRPIATRGRSQLILDLGDITFADTAGRDALAATAELLGRTGGELVVATNDPRLLRLFDGWTHTWRLERTLAEAVERVVTRQYA